MRELTLCIQLLGIALSYKYLLKLSEVAADA